MRRVVLVVFVSLLGFVGTSNAQKYTEESLRTILDSLSQTQKGLNNDLQLNVSSLQLAELVNSIALESNLNVSVDPSLQQLISYNFFDAQIKDVFVFLYLNFEIEYDFIGSIISMRRREKKEVAVELPKSKRVEVEYNKANDFLSMNLRNDTLWMVTEELTRISGKNFVVDPAIRSQVVNAYLLNRPFDQVVDMFVKSNALNLEQVDDYYKLSKGTPEESASTQIGKNGKPNYASKNKTGDFVLTKNDVGTIDVFARDVELNDLVRAAADETGVHYVVYSALQGKVNLDLQDTRFDELINKVFNGSSYSIEETDGIYLIGENKQEGLRKTDLIRLENRTIESVLKAIPKDLMEGLEVKEFEELNGLIVTGFLRKINELKSFISTIDVVVPMVQIDVMLLYSSKGSSVRTGMKAGVGTEPTQTSGTVFPGFDMNLGAQSINNILNSISGFGVVNLGQVTENFYISLSALESNNVIEIESTPKISTLNGHEASISIGETTYYQETQVNVQTSVTNQGVLQSKQWKSIDANLSVKIKPFVSADEYVTLTITVEQDDFSGKVDPTSPPNITTQTFESVVRVKNGELILLGGLDKKKKNDSGSGTPILSRIPVLKWFFSSRAKDKEKSKLHILIKPIVTY